MFDVNDFIENLRNGELWIAYLLLFVPIIYSCICQLMIAMDLNYITKDKLERLKPVILKISNQLNGLKKSLNRNT